MRYLAILLTVFLFTGCALYPDLKMPDQWKSLSGTSKAAAEVVNANKQKETIDKATEADKKVEDARRKMEIEYAKYKEEVKQIYEDRTKKDNENFTKIGELNYGIYLVTQEKKKQDIGILIAHLRSKEIMNRVDKMSDSQKSGISQDIEKEKTQTTEELYAKYKVSVELAIAQKADLDKAEMLIAEKEKEKAAMREANKVTISRLEAERNAEISKLKKDAQDNIEIAKEAQRQLMIGWIVKCLGGIGILLLVVGLLLRSAIFTIAGIVCIGLAYIAATVPIWVIGTVTSLIVLALTLLDPKTGKFTTFGKQTTQ